MRKLLLIGIGAGDPDHLTLAAAKAIDALDVLFVVTKHDEEDELVGLRRAIVARHRTRDGLRTVALPDPPRPWREAPDYRAAVAAWRAARADAWEAAFARELADDVVGGFLVWGDPSLYESTLAVVDDVAARGTVAFEHRVLPGVSSVHALTARHRIALNRVGRPVQITPARVLEDRGFPADVDDVVVMLDARQTFARIDPEGLDIYWGAFLGTPDELLVSGPLATARDRVLDVRAEAKARKGWMFDLYLLRRDPS